MASKTVTDQAKLAETAQHIIIVLAIQFLLGMAVNLIGLPDEAGGGAKVATSIFLVLHVVIAVGLVTGTVIALKLARKLGGGLARLTGRAVAAIGITFAAGVLTLITGNNWWSYLMAAGFVGSLLLYGMLYMRARS